MVEGVRTLGQQGVLLVDGPVIVVADPGGPVPGSGGQCQQVLALVLGALGCAGLPYLLPGLGGSAGTLAVLCAGALLGAVWVAAAGALRQWRGVNETISSLLLGYIAIALFKHVVEGPLRDPASLNKPSTLPLDEALRIGSIGNWDVHWGLVWGVLLCLAAGIWLLATTHGFATRVVGGNPRTAQLVGLPATRLIITACALGGACAGLAGGIEVAAVHTAANASLIVGLGYTGILVSFVARHQPLAIVPVAILFGGFLTYAVLHLVIGTLNGVRVASELSPWYGTNAAANAFPVAAATPTGFTFERRPCSLSLAEQTNSLTNQHHHDGAGCIGFHNFQISGGNACFFVSVLSG